MTQTVVRFGALSFLNAYPFRLTPSELPESLALEITFGTPAELNAAMGQGLLDVSLVSSAYYLRHQDRLQPLANLSIASAGPTESVYLALPQDAQQGETIAVPQTSETSVALAAHWIQSQTGKAPSHQGWPVYAKGESTQWLARGVPTLLIGDEALAHRLEDHPHSETVIDLGAWWFDHTGTPFVFALWVAQKDFIKAHPQAVQAFETFLNAKKDAFYTQPQTQQAVLDQAFAAFSHWPQGVIHRYLTQVLTYNLGPAERQGLAQFAQVLSQLDHTPSVELCR